MGKQEWIRLQEEMVYSFLQSCDVDDFWPVYVSLVEMQVKHGVYYSEHTINTTDYADSYELDREWYNNIVNNHDCGLEN